MNTKKIPPHSSDKGRFQSIRFSTIESFKISLKYISNKIGLRRLILANYIANPLHGRTFAIKSYTLTLTDHKQLKPFQKYSRKSIDFNFPQQYSINIVKKALCRKKTKLEIVKFFIETEESFVFLLTLILSMDNKHDLFHVEWKGAKRKKGIIAPEDT